MVGAERQVMCTLARAGAEEGGQEGRAAGNKPDHENYASRFLARSKNFLTGLGADGVQSGQISSRRLLCCKLVKMFHVSVEWDRNASKLDIGLRWPNATRHPVVQIVLFSSTQGTHYLKSRLCWIYYRRCDHPSTVAIAGV